MKVYRYLMFFVLILITLPLCGASAAESGDTISLGQWNGLPLTWRILTKDSSKALLYAEYSLPSLPYNTETKAVTWQTCSLRKWLQETFITQAFSDVEIRAVCTVLNDNPPVYGTDGGPATEDTIFLLSRAELEAYFPVLKNRKTQQLTAPDINAKAGTVAFVSPYDLASPYWLRSPGVDEKHAACVSWSGVIESHSVKAGDIAVRPAMWVDLSILGL